LELTWIESQDESLRPKVISQVSSNRRLVESGYDEGRSSRATLKVDLSQSRSKSQA